VVHLSNQLVLSEVLPQGDVTNEVISGVEIVRPDEGKSVACCTSRGASREKSSCEHERENETCQTKHAQAHVLEGAYVLQCGHRLLGPSQKVKTLPEGDTVEEVRVTSMYSQPVGTYSRCLINFLSLFLVHKPTLYHPPADGPL
jgi:hypothetical protein